MLEKRGDRKSGVSLSGSVKSILLSESSICSLPDLMLVLTVGHSVLRRCSDPGTIFEQNEGDRSQSGSDESEKETSCGKTNAVSSALVLFLLQAKRKTHRTGNPFP